MYSRRMVVFPKIKIFEILFVFVLQIYTTRSDKPWKWKHFYEFEDGYFEELRYKYSRWKKT